MVSAQEQNKEEAVLSVADTNNNDDDGAPSNPTVAVVHTLATVTPNDGALQSGSAAYLSTDASTISTATAAAVDMPIQQSRPVEEQVEQEEQKQASQAPIQSTAPDRPYAVSPNPPPPSTRQFSLSSEGYTNLPHDHPIVRGNNSSPSPVPDTTATSSSSLSPGSPSRSRLRPLSVTIDLSTTPAQQSEPPAYAEQYQLQTMTPSSYETRPPSSLSSTRQQFQQQQHHHQRSLSFTPEPIVTTIAGTSGAGAGTGSQLSPSIPIPVSASINLSLSGYRRPFLEEDELPDYISMTDSNLPFKLPSARSITYKVSCTQGPAEFQQQQQQQFQGGQHDIPTSPAPQESTLRLQRSNSEAGPGTAILHNDTLGDDIEVGQDLGSVGQESSPRRRGAWTMEYWVGDTILYLCYLMDPKMSAITELIPRIRSAHTTNPTSIPNPFTLAGSIRLSAATNTNTVPVAAMTAQDAGQQSANAVAVDMTQTNAQRSSAAGTGTWTGTSNNDDDTENEGMERVPTGHIRGGPPPISRTRYNTTRSQVSPQQTARSNFTFVGRRGTMTAPPLNAVALPSPAAPSAATMEEQEASGPTGTRASGVEDSTAQEATSESIAATAEVTDQPVVTEGGVQESAEEPVAFTSTTANAGPLPVVRHIRINDGYPGEEADAILAHAVARIGVPGDQQDSQGHAYNSALTSEFYKVPSFAFVSAEDPQTWVWWSTHHENNLQRCRQEGPNEEVMMWWRSRHDDEATSSKARRKQNKKEKRMGLRPSENKTIKERWRRFWSLKASVPYRESMEITMRVRGLYYAWREESYTGDEEMNDIQILDSNPPRYFRLVRDDSLVMGQRVKGGPVAEIVIHGRNDDEPLPSVGSDALGGGGESTHVTETLDAPPYGPIPSIRSDGSSITSNNGNTFMTQVSAATGGPVRSTVASTYIHRVSQGRRSGASSMRYHLSDPETPAPTIGDGRRHSLAPSEPASSSSLPLAPSPDIDDDLDQFSSFSSNLRKRTCTIRILEGVNSEVETFALSTGPRLPELFDLFTDQSVPGPSRATFIFSIAIFSGAFMIVFLSIALTTKH